MRGGVDDEEEMRIETCIVQKCLGEEGDVSGH